MPTRLSAMRLALHLRFYGPRCAVVVLRLSRLHPVARFVLRLGPLQFLTIRPSYIVSVHVRLLANRTLWLVLPAHCDVLTHRRQPLREERPQALPPARVL